VINSIAALKRRAIPDTLSHTSVGTEGDLKAREESRAALDSLRLTREHLASLILKKSQMQDWGYVVDIPEGPGGDKPSEEGGIRNCERCSKPFIVKRMEEAEECLYHWGRPFTKSLNGKYAQNMGGITR
jgi:RNA exonuclease 1